MKLDWYNDRDVEEYHGYHFIYHQHGMEIRNPEGLSLCYRTGMSAGAIYANSPAVIKRWIDFGAVLNELPVRFAQGVDVEIFWCPVVPAEAAQQNSYQRTFGVPDRKVLWRQ